MERLVPTRSIAFRYYVGASVTICRVTTSGPGETRAFTLPEGEDGQLFHASARADGGADIAVEFGNQRPK